MRFVVARRPLVARAGLTAPALYPYRGSFGAGVNMKEKLVALLQRGNIRPVSGALFLGSRHVANNGG
jgi:hypothetical protein